MSSATATAMAAEGSLSPFQALSELTGKALENPDAIARIVDGIKVAAEALRDIAVQRTEQTRIRMDAQAEVERIHAVRDAMLTYLDRSFDERRRNFDALFERLDLAMAQGSVDAVAKTLDAVVALAKSSPFKDLADAAKGKEVLKDKTHEWVF